MFELCTGTPFYKVPVWEAWCDSISQAAKSVPSIPNVAPSL